MNKVEIGEEQVFADLEGLCEKHKLRDFIFIAGKGDGFLVEMNVAPAYAISYLTKTTETWVKSLLDEEVYESE